MKKMPNLLLPGWRLDPEHKMLGVYTAVSLAVSVSWLSWLYISELERNITDKSNQLRSDDAVIDGLSVEFDSDEASHDFRSALGTNLFLRTTTNEEYIPTQETLIEMAHDASIVMEGYLITRLGTERWRVTPIFDAELPS